MTVTKSAATEKEFYCRELRKALEMWEKKETNELGRKIWQLCDRLDEIEGGEL